MEGFRYCPICGSALTRRVFEGKERPCCSKDGCGYVVWGNPVPVVAALVQKEGMVILARNKGWPQKVFGLITGFLEKGEEPQEAARREVKEELGLEAEVISLIGVYALLERNQVIIAYHLVAEGEIALGEELAEVKLIPPHKLRPWPFGTGLAVRDWLTNYKEGVS